MRPIYQRCTSDCFPTCVAMIAGISHRQAIKLIHPFHIKGTEYSTPDEDAIKTLRYLGFKVRKRYLKNFEELNSPAILVIEDNDTAHVSVWDPESQTVFEPVRGWNPPISYYKEKLQYIYIIT